MTIIIQPLSDHEKKLLRRIFKIRIIFSIFITFTILFFIVGIFGIYILDSNNSAPLIVLTGMILILTIIIYKYALPFYINSYKNTKETKKMVIVTKIINIERTIFRGVRYVVETEYRMIDSYAISIIDYKPPFLFSDLYVGMLIEIHCLENNKTDILRINKL